MNKIKKIVYNIYIKFLAVEFINFIIEILTLQLYYIMFLFLKSFFLCSIINSLFWGCNGFDGDFENRDSHSQTATALLSRNLKNKR